MKLEIKLFANFREYLPAGSEKYTCWLEVEAGTTIAQALGKLKIPESLPMITLVNGIHLSFDTPLQPGDVLSVFPPVAGGGGQLRMRNSECGILDGESKKENRNKFRILHSEFRIGMGDSG